MSNREPDAEVHIDPALIQRLINEQAPEYADMEISFVDKGWDNENYRLGKDYLFRIPRRQVGADLLAKEMLWLPGISETVSETVPYPLVKGEPTEYYPWVWAIYPWIEGKPLTTDKLAKGEARRMVRFLKELHAIDATEAPYSPFRSIPLVEKSEMVNQHLESLKANTSLISSWVIELWEKVIRESIPEKKVLIHGDLHPRNILHIDGKISGIIDWGDMAAGDPSTDLASLYMCCEESKEREAALHHYGASEKDRLRAMGWALYYAILLTDTGMHSGSVHEAIGRRIFDILKQTKG